MAAAFAHAGGDGALSTLPDAAIEASLRARGLGWDRQDLTFDDPKAYGAQPTSGYADDPVNTFSGNFVETETDLAFEAICAGLSFERTYNSHSQRGGAFGPGWSSWTECKVRAGDEGADVVLPDGREVFFPRLGSGYDRAPGASMWLVPAEDGGYLLDQGSGQQWRFDATGVLDLSQTTVTAADLGDIMAGLRTTPVGSHKWS